MTAWMTTFTGKQIDIINVKDEEIDIVDIAHHLAVINRFGGASRVPLSVAQHSVYVARLCSQENSLQGLLHDAAEAYMGDIVHWLKQDESFIRYRQIEHILQQRIFRVFGCDEFQRKEVFLADRLMCKYEASRVMHPIVWAEGYREPTKEEKKAIGRWTPWSWKTAEEVFLVEARLRGLKC